MASTGKCPFCGGVIRSDERTCPHCAAENANYIEDTPRTIHRPRTIDELKEYCAERGMPLLRMRFFIGEDFKEPKAFGIYRDGKNVVVYKNKADGSRAIRYQGPDEERGVNELFQKLLDECHNRGIYPDGKPVTRSGSGKDEPSEKRLRGKHIFLIVLCSILFLVLYFIWVFRHGSTKLQAFSLLFVCVACFTGPIVGEIQKRVRQSGSWKKDKDTSASHSVLTAKDYWDYIRKAFWSKVPKRSKLSLREQEAAKRVGWVPATLWVLIAVLLTMAVTSCVHSSIQSRINARNRRTEERLARIMADDGYYDFGDGRIYYNNFDDWYYTDADGSSTFWLKMKSAPRLPDGTRVTSSNEGPFFLQERWDESWTGTEWSYSNSRDGNQSGYYDFGDGQIYYNRDGHWFSSPRSGSDDRWSTWGNSDDYGITLVDGSSVSALDLDQYYLSDSWDADWGVSSVTGSVEWDNYYGDHSSSSSRDSWGSSDYDSWDSDDTDWDSDWDSDYDSWDSDDSDWDSDW